MKEVYCIPNAPKQNGDLWVEVKGDVVKVMNPSSNFWRGKEFTIGEFRRVFKEAK